MFLSPGSRARAKGGFAKGTVLLFYMASAPIGWSKLTTENDKALRVVSGTGGVAGGTNAFSTVFAQTVVGGTSISTAQLAAHTHTIPYDDVSTPPVGGNAASSGVTVSRNGSGGGSAGSGTSHNHTITMSIQFIDLILARKN